MPRIELDIAEVRKLPLIHQATIPEEYLDAMGHMNVMWYTHLFSVSMGELFQLFGLTWDYMEQNHVGTFALETHIRYLSEVRVGQTVEVHSRMLGRTEKRFHVMHIMTNQTKNDVSATFEVVGGYVSMETRRMDVIPENIAAQIDEMVDEHRELHWNAPVTGIMHP